MEYEIAYGRSVEALVRRVKNMIAEGWEPIGGVAVHEGASLYQAMIRQKRGA